MPESIKHNASIIGRINMSHCKQNKANMHATEKVDRTV